MYATTDEAFARGGWHWPSDWHPYRVTRCRWQECGELILWAITRRGAMAPLNRDGVSHFATCPGAEKLRKRKRREESR